MLSYLIPLRKKLATKFSGLTLVPMRKKIKFMSLEKKVLYTLVFPKNLRVNSWVE